MEFYISEIHIVNSKQQWKGTCYIKIICICKYEWNSWIRKNVYATIKFILDIRRTLEEVGHQSRLSEAKAKGANVRADDLLQRLDNDLIPKYESIRAGTVGGLENLTRISKC